MTPEKLEEKRKKRFEFLNKWLNMSKEEVEKTILLDKTRPYMDLKSGCIVIPDNKVSYICDDGNVSYV